MRSRVVMMTQHLGEELLVDCLHLSGMMQLLGLGEGYRLVSFAASGAEPAKT